VPSKADLLKAATAVLATGSGPEYMHPDFVPISREDLLAARNEFGVDFTTHQMIRAMGGEGSDKVTSPSSHDIDLTVVRAGRDDRTSLMVRDIPTSYTQAMLVKEFMLAFNTFLLSRGLDSLSEKFSIDFIYLPFNMRRRQSNGYAFISVSSTDCVAAVYQAFHGYRCQQMPTTRLCKVSYSKVQGITCLINQFNPENIIKLPRAYRPVISKRIGKYTAPMFSPELRPVPVVTPSLNVTPTRTEHGDVVSAEVQSLAELLLACSSNAEWGPDGFVG